MIGLKTFLIYLELFPYFSHLHSLLLWFTNFLQYIKVLFLLTTLLNNEKFLLWKCFCKPYNQSKNYLTTCNCSSLSPLKIFTKDFFNKKKIKKNHTSLQCLLNHYSPVWLFYNPWKHQKTCFQGLQKSNTRL